MLTSHFEDHNTIGQWMAHHLAQLIVAAQDDASTTVEQRLQIVDLILKVWTQRRYYPTRAPLEEYVNVFTALDRLGDGSPWKFSRPFDADTNMPDTSTVGLPLVATASELENLTRETLIRLIWLEARDAKNKNQEWLEAADKIASNIESDVTTTLGRLRRRVARRRRLRATEADQADVAETPTEDVGDAQDAGLDVTQGVGTDGLADDGTEPEHDGPSREDDDPLSDSNHIKRLREMADLLNKVADALTGPDFTKEKGHP
ncbi:hypothetical protein OPAG_06817 [Rhodococcus opacus PD630]|nr:hypothetical protein Pd630_LPD16047 [Rhodococcus opacus PD630]EHI43538.1 hypothetical protein OPAG_06817 [Rhodococcus opacus PD630]